VTDPTPRPSDDFPASVTVPPGEWTAACVDTNGDTIDVLNLADSAITLKFTGSALDDGSAVGVASGWRTRHRAYVPADRDLPGGALGQERWEADRDRREQASAQEVRERIDRLVNDGVLRVARQYPDGEIDYSLTEVGARYLEQLTGMPVGTVRHGDGVMDR
jgi:hypothetical protein